MGAWTPMTARRTAAVLAMLALVLAVPGLSLLVARAPAAGAQCAPRLVVSKTSGLAPGGEAVTLRSALRVHSGR